MLVPPLMTKLQCLLFQFKVLPKLIVEPGFFWGYQQEIPKVELESPAKQKEFQVQQVVANLNQFQLVTFSSQRVGPVE